MAPSSLCFSPISAESPFSVHNLPDGVSRSSPSSSPRPVEPFKWEAPKQDPPCLPYFPEPSRSTYDISLEVAIEPEEKQPVVGRTNSKYSNPSLSSDESLINVAVEPAYHQQELTFTPSPRHFYSLLQKCIQDEDVILGKEVHSKIVESGLISDPFLGSHLIRMFTVFGDLWEANEVFKGLSRQSVYAWSAIISAHTSLGYSEQAMELYFELRASSLEPDGHIFVAVLQACAYSASLSNGIIVHNDIIGMGLDTQIFVANTLIDMYAKCGSLQDACILFKRLPERDVVTWNAMIGGFGQHGHVQEAIHTLACMSREGFQPDSVSFVCCLIACSNGAALEKGKEIHTGIVMYGLDTDMKVYIALIDLFVKCGCLHDARAVFDKGRQDAGTYESMAMTYFQHGHDHEVCALVQEMKGNGMVPTLKTFICFLRACSSIGDLDQGWKIHSDIIESGFEGDTFVGNTLVDLYGKCSSLEDAQVVFDTLHFQDVVSWSALISGYAMHERSGEGIRMLQAMQKGGLEPNEITFSSVLKACSGMAILDDGLEQGRWVHSLIIGNGFEQNEMLGSALIDMYAKGGDLDNACVVFEKLPEQDVVTWSALITGFTLHGYGQEALQSFKKFQRKGVEPISGILVSVLKACSLVAALEQAKQIHGYIICRGLESETAIGSALIDMYAKCGSLLEACAVFESLQNRDIITWGTMMASFAQHNNYPSAIKCFEDMQEDGLLPNEVIFTCLLTTCSHANQLEEGCRHFKSMREHHGLLPTLEHYYCLVELLGRAGRFDEAEDLIESVPYQSNIVGWMSLLASCRRHGNVKLGERCFQHAIRLNPGYSSEYVLMRNLYSGAGLLDDARSIEELRISANAWKKPAKAFIEVDNNVHSFVVADKVHPRSNDIYAKLKCLIDKVKSEGYSSVSDSGSVKDEDLVSVHSEKLAIAFGLICTPEGSTIRLSKNLRVCTDCHSVAKAISKIEMRDIIITDAYQIHHFQNGECSCVNFW